MPMQADTAGRRCSRSNPGSVFQTEPKAYLCPVLHCHLPFVRHPEHEEFLEEDWLFEAVTESYLPLLDLFERLAGEGVRFRATLCVSPPLCEMLADELLQGRCASYVERRLELAEREVAAREGTDFHAAAVMYRQAYRRALDSGGRRCGVRLLEGFARLQELGFLDIVASAATHALLPLLGTPQGLRAQIEQGCRSYREHFGRRPAGMWLPECAFTEGMDRVLRDCGIEYFFLESHGVLLASPSPADGVFSPIITPAGTAAFGRDIETSRQVWSAREGYPGDALYREFYRDLGHDADYEYIRPYLHPDGVRRNVGIKYFRITGDVPLDAKRPYMPDAARRRAEEHAGHFLLARQAQARRLAGHVHRPPIVVCPYDAELFGHWWLEGPHFLECLLRKTAGRQDSIRLSTAAEYLAENPRQQAATPAASSWGDRGYFEVWLNGSNDWVYPHLHHAERTMVELAAEFPRTDGLLGRALNQCARELMLAQSSDWPFLMSVNTARGYAASRVREHVSRVHSLARQVRSGRVDEGELSRTEAQRNIFARIDYRLYAPGQDRSRPAAD